MEPHSEESRTNVNHQSPKFLEARGSLPLELRPIYDRLVEEYAFQTFAHYGRGYIAYRVLASLIRSGWRLIDKPIE
jgi:hypothetical protein